jgi:hypothetical protein
MMLPTHVATGLLLGVAASQILPLGDAAVLVAVAGAVMPDLDIVLSHKRTLHYPVIGPACAVLFWFMSPYAGILALSAGLHVVMDVFSNGKTMRPGTDPDPRAVYSHVSGGWISPLHLFPTGSVRDLALCMSIAWLAAAVRPSAWFLSVSTIASAVLGRYALGFVRRGYPEYDRLSEYLKDRLL